MTDGSGSTSWTYDSAGRLSSKTQNVGGDVRTVSVTRDGVGRVTRMTYPSGMRVDASYNGDVLSALTVNGTALLSNVTYLPFSQTATGWTWGNGSAHARSFDANGLVTAVALGPTTRSYSYDAANRIVGYDDARAGSTSGHTLGYDEAGQLYAYVGPEGSFSYAYDTNGNRRSAVQYGAGGSLSYQANSNRLLSSPRGTYSYDAAGNPTTDGYLGFSYDAYGQLVKLSTRGDYETRSFNGQHMRVQSAAWVLESSCDNAVALQGAAQVAPATQAANRRRFQRATTTLDRVDNAAGTISKTSATSSKATPQRLPCNSYWTKDWQTTYLHDDGGALLGEYDTVNNLSQETIWFNGQPVGAMIDGVPYYVKSDHLGTPRSIARPSDNAEVWRWDGDPFGNHFPTNPTAGAFIVYNLRMPGQQYDPYSGYYYNWMRDYDPYTGRYIQADPLGLGGGLSRYTYAGGNPNSKTDPTGLICVCGATYGERYMNFVTDNTINLGPYAAGLLGGVLPKSLAPATGGRGPLLGSTNPLTSVARACGVPGAGNAVARTGAAGIGLATVGIGMFNATMFAQGLLYAIPSPTDGGCSC